jgi:hypothetical protein
VQHGRDVFAFRGRCRSVTVVVRSLVAGLCLVVAGCGTADVGSAPGSATATPATPAVPGPSVLATPATTTTALDAAAAAGPAPAPATSAADPGSGCRAELRGARVAQVQRPPGPNAAATSLWFDAAELARTGFATPGRAGMTVNCDDRDATVNLLLSADTPAAALAPGPGRYPIAATGAPGTFALLVALSGDPRVWTVTAGEVVLTAHDTNRLTGTFSATLHDALGGGGTTDTLAIVGSFDQPCAVGARCGR